MEERMRERINQWADRAKAGGAHLGAWIRRYAILLALALLLTAIGLPRKAQGQPTPCCALLAEGLGTINVTLGSVIAGGLQAINIILNNTNNFLRTTVWPPSAIAQALGMAGQIQGFYARIRAILQIPIATATLPNPRQLESILLSRSPTQIGSTSGGYANVYGTVPPPQNASPRVRDMIDVTDAIAQDAMQRAIAIDAIADQELSAADQINANIQGATPGTAPIIEAQADAWLVRAHAYTQSALSDLIRVRAIDLANASAHLKIGSAWAVTTQQNVGTTLQHK
jgi:hypothetical protein